MDSQDNDITIMDSVESISTSNSTSMKTLFECESLKWIFVGGKGGVGKTTTSCSVAVELARRRESILILSTDPAHNLSDAFKQKFSNTPSLVNGFTNLFAMEIDNKRQENMEFKLSRSQTFTKLLPQMLETFPGIDEALSFAELMRHVQTMKYSVIVFDTAPTGHTLRLLSFPELLESALKKLLALKDQMSGAMSVFKMVSGQSVEADELSADLDTLKAITSSVKSYFQDPTKTTFVCVCIPEFLSVYETERLVQELSSHNIDCSNIVVNQVTFPIEDIESADTDYEIEVPEGASKDEECQILRSHIRKITKRLNSLEKVHNSRRRMQSKYLLQIEDLYAEDFNIACIPQMTEEVRGTARLNIFSSLLMGERKLPILKEAK